jgi:type I restriction enzyme S subunit
VSSKWKSAQLRELLTIQNGFAFNSKKFESSGMPLIRIRDLRNGRHTQICFTGEYSEEYVVHSGDLLVGMDGEFRCYRWEGGPALLNQRVCRLREFSDLLVPEFLRYGLDRYLIEIEKYTTFTTVKHLSSKDILNIDFPLPPLDEQKRIVAKLDEASMQLEFLDQVNAKSKVSEGLFIQRFIDARINEMLTEVDQSPLGDVALLVRGPFGGSLKKSMFVATGYPIYEQQHPISGDLSSFRYFIDVEKFESMKRFAVSAGDVLMSCSGTFGKVVEVTQQAPVGVINQALLKITPSPDINSSYLKTLMTSDYFQEHVRVGVLGSAMQNVASVAELKAIPIPVPDLDTQKEFVSEAEALQAQSRRMGDIRKERSRQIIQLREAILSAAFAGKL